MNTSELTIAATDKGIQLDIQGDFNIESCDKMKLDLLTSASREGEESLNLSKTTAMDVVGIQLAYAWKIALAKKNRTATVIQPKSENIKDLFDKTGITQIL
jgi:anti-anti-sigma regulatory factor